MMKRYVLAGLTGLILIPFQNCSMNAEHTSSTLESFAKTCETPLMEVYRTTYYPAFKSSCTSCHSDGGESGRYFASSDLRTGFSWFKSIGRATIEAKAQDLAHRPPRTGPQHAAMIQAARGRWLAAEAEYSNCAGGSEVETIGKSNAAIYTNPANPATPLPWNRVTWQMLADVKRASQLNVYPLEISLEVRRYRITVSGTLTDLGYEFRNPRIRVLDDGNATTPIPVLRLRGLSVLFNDTRMTTFTLFGSLDHTTTGTAEALMAPGVGYAPMLSAVSNTDQFGIRIESIVDAAGVPVGPGPGPGPAPGPVLPTRVSFADLTSANQQLGVFTQSCRGCHNAGNAAGGLNLDDYTQAFNASGNIVARMGDAMRPMPPAGVLSQEKRDIVGIWVSSGRPQN